MATSRETSLVNPCRFARHRTSARPTHAAMVRSHRPRTHRTSHARLSRQCCRVYRRTVGTASSPRDETTAKRKSPEAKTASGLIDKPGNDLLSHARARAVPSALEGLTSEFGMGSGMAPPTSSPEKLLMKSREEREAHGLSSWSSIRCAQKGLGHCDRPADRSLQTRRRRVRC
jgi:hypothetical protein